MPHDCPTTDYAEFTFSPAEHAHELYRVWTSPYTGHDVFQCISYTIRCPIVNAEEHLDNIPVHGEFERRLVQALYDMDAAKQPVTACGAD